MEGRASILSKEAFFLNLATVAIEYKVGMGTVEVEMIGCRILLGLLEENENVSAVVYIFLLLAPWCLRQQERDREGEKEIERGGGEREKENHV